MRPGFDLTVAARQGRSVEPAEVCGIGFVQPPEYLIAVLLNGLVLWVGLIAVIGLDEIYGKRSHIHAPEA